MKKTIYFKLFSMFMTLLCLFAFVSCKDNNKKQEEAYDDSDVVIVDPVYDTEVNATETFDTFNIESSDGVYEFNENIYTITSGGTYSLSGRLEGQILVNAKGCEVVLELKGTTIINDSDSPIKVLKADTLEISAKKDTSNVIKDTRTTKVNENDDLGEGAISAKCDLKLKGTGVLEVIGNYNNGIHTTKDLTIQKLTLKVTAYNNAIKGKDSVTIKSGKIVCISTNGDGIETSNTDVNKNGVTRGDITIQSASVTVYACSDAIQSAHNFLMEDNDNIGSNLIIYTSTYSGYSAKNTTNDSFKGIKVKNELTINSGSVTIKSYDDGLHADYGDSFDDGNTGVGTININGGIVNIEVYSPTSSTFGGMFGPGKTLISTESGADGIHADNILNIRGGVVNIDSSWEGLEANTINISGGKTIAMGNDDGVNACKLNSKSGSVNITGGYLEVSAPANGDTDGIDCNGSYLQTGGVVVTKGPNNEVCCALDTEGNCKITGGTLIILGYARVDSKVKTYNFNLNSKGNHTVTIDGTEYTISNLYSYSKTICYSSVNVEQKKEV